MASESHVPSAEWLLARDLIRKHGWNTTCGQLLNPGLRLWFSTDREAVVGYVVERGVRVVVGAPVCALEDLPSVVEEFERLGGTVCYFGAEERLHSVFKGRTGAQVVLGAQPVWLAAEFLAEMRVHPSLRAQLNRARNKGVVVREEPDPSGALLADLELVLHEWLSTRGLPPLHFMIEPNTFQVLGDRRLFVAERQGKACGFVVLSPIPARNGYLTEQFVRGRAAPNGTVELALYSAVERAHAEGSEYLTMGIVPLSLRVDPKRSENPPWLNATMSWARAHLRRFYDFEGLDDFKAKFDPSRWDPVYVLTNQAPFRPKTLHAIAGAFTGGHPLRALAGGVIRAARSEVRWLIGNR